MTSGINISTGVQQPFFPVFDGENYDYWCVKMKTIFLSYDLWDLIEIGYEDPTEEMTIVQMNQLKENKKKDAKALHLIQQGVTDIIFSRIINATKSKEA